MNPSKSRLCFNSSKVQLELKNCTFHRDFCLCFNSSKVQLEQRNIKTSVFGTPSFNSSKVQLERFKGENALQSDKFQFQ